MKKATINPEDVDIKISELKHYLLKEDVDIIVKELGISKRSVQLVISEKTKSSVCLGVLIEYARLRKAEALGLGIKLIQKRLANLHNPIQPPKEIIND